MTSSNNLPFKLWLIKCLLALGYCQANPTVRSLPQSIAIGYLHGDMEYLQKTGRFYCSFIINQDWREMVDIKLVIIGSGHPPSWIGAIDAPISQVVLWVVDTT